MMCVHLSGSTVATCTHLPYLPVSMRRYFSGLCMRQRDKHKRNRHAGWHRYIRNINNHNKSEHQPPDLRTTRRHGCQQMPFPTRLCELALPMMAHVCFDGPRSSAIWAQTALRAFLLSTAHRAVLFVLRITRSFRARPHLSDPAASLIKKCISHKSTRQPTCVFGMFAKVHPTVMDMIPCAT